jgi:hypothetical protein
MIYLAEEMNVFFQGVGTDELLIEISFNAFNQLKVHVRGAIL